jgi:hypothetical protein
VSPPKEEAAERGDENHDDQMNEASVVDLDAKRNKNSPASSLKAQREKPETPGHMSPRLLISSPSTARRNDPGNGKGALN